MTFYFINDIWKLKTFHLCFFNTETLGKTADEHEAIMKVDMGDEVLTFSGNSGKEAATVLGVD